MLCVKSVSFLISLFIVCYTQSVETDKRKKNELYLPSSYEHAFTTTDIADVSLVDRGYSDLPNFTLQHKKLIIVPNRARVTETGSRQGLLPIKHGFESTPVELRKQHTESTNVPPNNYPTVTALHMTSSYGDDYVTKHVKRSSSLISTREPFINTSTIVPGGFSKFKKQPVSKLYDRLIGRTYLCYSDEECTTKYLENSECHKEPDSVGLGKCKCLIGYFYDGEECIWKESVIYCTSHEFCIALEGSRCTYLTSTKEVKFCRCPINYTFVEHKCLQKVAVGESCVSSKQCPLNVPCLMDICRSYCPHGYGIKEDHCVKDLPDINPPYYEKENFVLSNSAVLVGIIGGIFFLVVIVVSLVAMSLRRRMLEDRRLPTSSNSPLVSRLENSGSHSLGMSAPIYDEPPPYEEVIAPSTTTATANSLGTSADHLPSYRSWEEAYSNKTLFQRR